MKKFFCALLLMTAFFGGGKVLAQFTNRVWAFGDSAGISWLNSGTNPINFKTNSKWRNGSVSISDTNGLNCYAALFDNTSTTNVCIWNKYNTLMQNGDYNYGGWWYHVNLFIPDPGNDSLLYMFGIGVTNDPYGFYYSKLNYKANNDSGIVIQKNMQLNNFPAFDALMAVRHGNGSDWWLIFQRWYAPTFTTPSNEFFFYLIDDNGITGPFQQSIGLSHTTNGGHLVFDPTGDRFANISIKGMIELCYFDRCTGTITSTTPIEQEATAFPYPHYSSCAFSSDGTKLYVSEYSQTSAPSHLYQFDLNATNISSSKTVIDSFVNPDIGINALKLAPDNKIYLAAADENFFVTYPDTMFTTINSNLSVINQPDSLGLACDFQPFSFYLGGARTYYGLPNNPDYELGAWVGSPCDTLAVGVENLEPPQQAFFQAWYNSEWNMIHINASKLKGRTGSLRLFDMEGRLVYEKKMEVIAGGYVTGEIPMNAVANGVYFVNLITESESVSSKTIKF
ncbi:MAG: T9SS type A sorting domain-containing protein [Bacteroidetes bacterium]|nr:T9SS type A sorting domain-containing protein [Bacteroidota bacterium]